MQVVPTGGVFTGSYTCADDQGTAQNVGFYDKAGSRGKGVPGQQWWCQAAQGRKVLAGCRQLLGTLHMHWAYSI